MRAKTLVATILVAALACMQSIALAGCSGSSKTKSASNNSTSKVSYPDLVGEAMDYSKGENWLVRQENGDEQVDVFFLYPTAAEITCTDTITEINQFVRCSAWQAYEKGCSCFEEYTNVFVPFYRQISYLKLRSMDGYSQMVQELYTSVVRTDVYAALDYFFDYYNNGKPYILAGLSQGSYALQIVLSEYMQLHPDRYARMVACYAMGASFDSDYLSENPQVKMAQGETDTGVVIAWNTEAPGGTMESFVLADDAYCINPLNWKTDDTYADASENLGSYQLDSHSSVPGLIDAQIDLKRHVLVTTTAEQHGYATLPVELGAGDKSYHMYEADFFYGSLRDNAQKRIKAFL